MPPASCKCKSDQATVGRQRAQPGRDGRGQDALGRDTEGPDRLPQGPPEAWGPRWPILGPAPPQGLADEARNRSATQP